MYVLSYKMFLIISLFTGSLENEFLFRSKRETKQVLTERAKLFDKNLYLVVEAVENRIFCLDLENYKKMKFEWTCELITTIYISKNIAIDCKDLYLPVYFFVYHPVNENDSIVYLRDLVLGYLTNSTGLLGIDQSKSESCNIFKRYKI